MKLYKSLPSLYATLLALTLAISLIGCSSTPVETKNVSSPANITSNLTATLPPIRITDEMGRVWEQCGENQWCCISVPENIPMKEIDKPF